MSQSKPLPKSAGPTAEVAESGHRIADITLAELLVRDPHAAAPALYDRFAADVNRWVWNLMGADPDHHDIVQQVFIRVLRGSKRLRDKQRLAPWVHTITVHTVFGELRRREVRRLFLREHEPVSTHADFVHEVEVRDLLLRAKELINKLPAAERIAFLLHHAEECSLTQIAELCDYSYATAKRRLARAHQRFAVLSANSPELRRLLEKSAREGSS